MRAWAGSLVFAAGQTLVTVAFAFAALLTAPLPLIARYRFITLWCRTVVAMARLLCGIRARVHRVAQGAQPSGPVVYLSRHESAWETLAFSQLLPPHVNVVKRELLRIPFFGWGLALLAPIAIDRAAGRAALRQMLEQGRDRVAQGFSVVIFPEGTRKAPGERADFFIGGAWLACQLGVPVVPVAHNAGRCWGRGAMLKRPGTVDVVVGPTIDTSAGDAAAVNAQAKAWIDATCDQLDAAHRG